MSVGPDRVERTRVALDSVNALDGLLEQARHFFALPGGVISVVDRDGLLAQTTFGYADLERRVAMSSHYLFEIGSISKLFTSLVVNRLVDEGRLRLDETIGEVLPWWQASAAVRAATVAQLLNHTSGLCVGADTLPDDSGEIWNSRACAASESASPHFHYSNLGYLVLGEMARARSGRRVPELVREQWFGPLAMNDALAQVVHSDRPSLATGYWPARPDRPWAPGDALAPCAFFEVDSASGNIAASSADMVALVQALLGASAADPVRDEHDRPVISEDLFQRLISDPAPTGEPIYLLEGMGPVEESRYAMGINVERIDGHLCVSHGGGMVGFSTFMLVDCTAQVGVVVLTNANGDTLASHVLARIVLEDVVRRMSQRAPLSGLSFDSTVRAGGPVVPGRYGGDDGTSLEVVVDGTDLRIRFEGDEGHLYHHVGGRYVTDNPGLRTFHLDWFSRGDDSGFTYGATTFRAGAHLDALQHDAAHPLVGRYRSFSPWYPEFRIVERAGRLLLIAPGGVEAHGEETVLTEISPGEFRVGEEDWLPDRLRIEGVRDGQVISVDRDGCHYSRAFSD